MPGVDIKIDDPTITIDTSSTLYMIDSAYGPDPYFVASGGVQSTSPILFGLYNTTADGQGGDRLQQSFPVVSVGYQGGYDQSPTFDADGYNSPTFDRSNLTMDRV